LFCLFKLTCISFKTPFEGIQLIFFGLQNELSVIEGEWGLFWDIPFKFLQFIGVCPKGGLFILKVTCRAFPLMILTQGNQFIILEEWVGLFGIDNVISDGVPYFVCNFENDWGTFMINFKTVHINNNFNLYFCQINFLIIVNKFSHITKTKTKTIDGKGKISSFTHWEEIYPTVFSCILNLGKGFFFEVKAISIVFIFDCYW
jgi:hypothetical protein